MLANNDKIIIINKRLEVLEDMIESCNLDIQRIQDGMVDPDSTIEECNLLLDDLSSKKQALLEEKQALTNQ